MSKPNEPSPATEVPDAEIQKCFECGALLPPDAPHGVSVAEAVLLCPDCCTQRHPDSVRWQMPAWFEDLAGARHHT